MFKARSLRSGAQIPQWDFGDAIVWEGGLVRYEAVRQALREPFENGYLIEYSAAFELTEEGRSKPVSALDIALPVFELVPIHRAPRPSMTE